MSEGGQGSEGMIDPEFGTVIWNDSEVANSEVMTALYDQHPEVAQIVRWSNNVMAPRRKKGSLFDRDRYVTPGRFVDQIDVARRAVAEDDVVSGVIDMTESLAFNRICIEADDPDEEDIWNQIAADLDLDSRLREMWRELATVSQIYVFQWWGHRSYKVRGKGKDSGNRRKKQFANLRVPLGLTLIDPRKIIPIGSGFFNQEKLLYIPDNPAEQEAIDMALADPQGDPLIRSMILYEDDTLDRLELQRLAQQWDFNLGLKLYVTNPYALWRHTLTKPQWKMSADLRLQSIFELLDMKTQLMEMDRAHLIGGTNFIILIKKGSDQIPAKPQELINLQNSVRTLARVPLLVGDHRLSIEIVTPKLDLTLHPERYDLIDSRIAMRMYQMFTTNSGRGTGGEDSLKLGRVIARGMESRRHMLRRAIEKHVLQPTYDANDALKDEPDLRFYPKQIALSFDTAQAMFFMDLRDRRELSRDTLLSQIDLSEDEEARKMQREAEYYDKIFMSGVPFSAPLQVKDQTVPSSGGGAANTPRAAGRTQGGNSNGGGAAPGTGQGQPSQTNKPNNGGSGRKGN